MAEVRPGRENAEESGHLDESTAPEPIGVYDRPQRQGRSTLVVFSVAALLLIIVLALFVAQSLF